MQVFVSRKYPEAHLPDEAVVPREVQGPDGVSVPTDVIEAGYFQPLQDTTRYRPVVGGCSIGNMTGINAGTLGGFVCDEDDDTTVFLTNNHVVTPNQQGIPADPRIVQPGRLDGGSAPADVIGSTKEIVPIPTSGSSASAPVTAEDSAIGTIDVDHEVRVEDIAPAPYEVGAAALGMNVQKRGRTTRLTQNGRVVSVNASWTLNYPSGWATIGTGGSVFNISSTDGNPFARRGDSGSLIFDQQEGELNNTFPVVGLLFAGGGVPFGTLIGACDIGTVFANLNLTSVCTCIVRAILESIEMREASDEETTGLRARNVEDVLRRYERRVLKESALGEKVVGAVRRNAPEITNVLIRDEKAFELAVDALEPWVRRAGTRRLLQAKTEEQDLARLKRFAGYLGECSDELEDELTSLTGELLDTGRESLTEMIGLQKPGRKDD